MILNSIKLHNYRLYQDTFIDFSNDNSNISIIRGNSAVGKTTLLNAISWCLYENEIFLGESPLGICNVEAGNSTEIDEDINVSVELTFDDNGETLVFRRVQGFHKGKNGLSTSDNKLEVLRKDGNEVVVYDDAIEVIEEKIPKRFVNYFLIEVSILDQFSTNHYFTPFIESYYNFSQLNIIESSIHHLERFKLSFKSGQKKIDSKIGKINEKINDIKNDITDVDEEKKMAQLEKKDILEKINETKEELNNTNVQIKFDRKIELERLMEKNSLELIDLKEELTMHILTKYPYIFAYESLNEFTEVCKKSEENINHLSSTIPVIKSISEFQVVSNDLHQKISQIENDQEKFMGEKREIDELLSSMDDDIKRLLHQYKQLNSYKHSIEIEIQKHSDTINNLNQELKEQLKSRDDEKEKLFKELQRSQKEISFCQEAIDVASDILTELKGNRLKRFEDLINELFNRMHWKNPGIVVFNTEGIFLQTHGGLIDSSSFTSLERYILALSFILAMHQIYDLNIPIILDTPLSRLDSDVRNKILELLIQFSREEQIILLLNNGEFGEVSQYRLKENNAKIFEISRKDKESWVSLNE